MNVRWRQAGLGISEARARMQSAAIAVEVKMEDVFSAPKNFTSFSWTVFRLFWSQMITFVSVYRPLYCGIAFQAIKNANKPAKLTNLSISDFSSVVYISLFPVA
jgi:hypothetical protein